jgi:hypothetical protein
MTELSVLEFWELISYVVTALGLPYAVWLYFADARRERQNEEETVYLQLSDEYANFQKVLLKNSDLQLVSRTTDAGELTPEQQERKRIIYEMLISLFERAYILVYEEDMNKQNQRLWATWNDYIEFWLQRSDFRTMLPQLLSGEDEDFVRFMQNKIQGTASA